MPNTLAHFGAQVLPWKLFDNKVDIKWLGVGCIIPDLPWIIQRIVGGLIPGIDLIDLRIYCMIQASLLFCLLLSAAIALLARHIASVFLILAVNSALHLLLDASQTKWANGVHFFAPLNWQLTQFQIFWPENSLTLILSVFGFAAIVLYGWSDRKIPILGQFSARRLICSGCLLALYLLLPLVFFSGPLQADNHYVRTLRETEQRTGRAIGFDRCHYDQKSGVIRIFTKELLKADGKLPAQGGTISLVGYFKKPDTVYITTAHQHGRARDFYSYAGLAALLLLWVSAAAGKRLKQDTVA